MSTVLTAISLISAPAFSAKVVSAGAKKTLCSITINSDNELQAFKKNLGTDDWNYVELATRWEQGESDFAGKNCRANLKCDVLIISGHFSGSFIGSRADTLPLKTMERLSCKRECDGIFKSPKAVFLFGCNTLSTVDSIDTNPDEFLNHLLKTGYTLPGAAAVIGFRTSANHESVKVRMAKVFSNTSDIFGFKSVAPTGEQIEKKLDGFIRDNIRRFEDLPLYGQLPKSGVSTYNIQDGLFSRTAGTQETKPYCELQKEVSLQDRLNYISRLFDEKLAISNLDHIIDFAKLHSVDLVSTVLRQNPNVNSTLRDTMAMKGDPYIVFKAKVLKAYEFLKLIPQSEYEDYKTEIFNVKSVFNLRKTQLLCNTGFPHVKLNIERIPNERWSESEFLSSLSCLPPSDLRTVSYLTDLILNGSIKKPLDEIALHVIRRAPYKDQEVINKVIRISKEPHLMHLKKLAETIAQGS